MILINYWLINYSNIFQKYAIKEQLQYCMLFSKIELSKVVKSIEYVW